MTVTGSTIGEEAATAVETPGRRSCGRSAAAQADRRPRDPSRQPRARTAAWSRSPGTTSARIAGPARVFDCEEAAFEAVQAGRIKAGDVVVIRYEGPKGGPGMREMLGVTARSSAPASASRSRSSPTAASPGATHGLMAGHVAPEAAAGGPIAAVRDGDIDHFDLPARTLQRRCRRDERSAARCARGARCRAALHDRRHGEVRDGSCRRRRRGRSRDQGRPRLQMANCGVRVRASGSERSNCERHYETDWCADSLGMPGARRRH